MAATQPAIKGDHRTLVAAERRERMRGRLVEGAFLVFGQRGVDGSVIDELIRIAGVSRGTFYNYFRTNEELLSAVATEISQEMLRIIDPILLREADPAVRISDSVRHHFNLIRIFPQFGAFVSRGGLGALENSRLLQEFLPRDIEQGMRTGRFNVASPQVGFDIVVGIALAGAHRMQIDPMPSDYFDAVVASILRALGIPPDEAREISQRTLPTLDLPPQSLFVRAKRLGETEVGSGQ